MKRYKTVDEFIEGVEFWHNELKILRKTLLTTPLEEGVKWGSPCYMIDGTNVVGLGAFKSYFGLWFFQGALLQDEKKLLINAQEGKTKALRQWRMTSGNDIKPRIIKSYVKEAIQLAQEGKAIPISKPKTLVIPDELKAALEGNKNLATKFKKLTPGCQREYAVYVAEAKREPTRLRRIEKIVPMILSGAGLNDKYR